MDSKGLILLLSGATIGLFLIKLKMDGNDNEKNEFISPYKSLNGNPTFAQLNSNDSEGLLLWPQPIQSVGPFHNQEPNWISSTAGFPAVPVRPSNWRRSDWTALQDPITVNGIYPISEYFTYLIEKPMPNGLSCSKDGKCGEGLVCNYENVCI